MFGRRVKLPIDIRYEPVTKSSNPATKDYLNELKDRMEKTKELVEKHTGKAKDKHKMYYDRKANAVKISVGDTV